RHGLDGRDALVQTLGCSERHERNLRKGMYSLTKNEEAGGIKAVALQRAWPAFLALLALCV
ncbi:MAG: hypothetical protein KK478_23885, partial [Ensifer alkalisoli]|nr:hypothetical protein [Sinorhizobium alkalisoli]